ncbi:hypothetical protein RSA11_04250 [Exiguobacterium indicum]|uniref:Uncharacterized protein n=1 Tax=Exiguobacterium indicum TaxID=296995 RepID=A0AAW3MFI9_9BACL|nr:hypothetical protein [Exiguobacterium indicum]KTR27883.1 hypothetical protein RSA11_04250 [Exiguobacterium indicum]
MGVKIDFVTSVFTALAAGAAAWSALISRNQFKDQTRRQKEQERPRLIPLNQELYLSKSKEYVDMSLSYEWKLSPDDQRQSSKKSDVLSQFSFPIINTGKSSAMKVKIMYTLENIHDVLKDIDNDVLNFIVHTPLDTPLEIDFFSFEVKEQKNLSPKGEYIENKFDVVPSEFRIPLIKSDETEQVRLPIYFMVLNNIYLENHQKIKPILRIGIEYVNSYHKKHIDFYRVELQKHKPNPNFDYEEYWLDFIKIDEKKAHP